MNDKYDPIYKYSTRFSAVCISLGKKLELILFIYKIVYFVVKVKDENFQVHEIQFLKLQHKNVLFFFF